MTEFRKIKTMHPVIFPFGREAGRPRRQKASRLISSTTPALFRFLFLALPLMRFGRFGTDH